MAATLSYSDTADAVRKTDSVLRSQTEEARLRERLGRQRREFAVTPYQQGIRRLVAETPVQETRTASNRA